MIKILQIWQSYNMTNRQLEGKLENSKEESNLPKAS